MWKFNCRNILLWILMACNLLITFSKCLLILCTLQLSQQWGIRINILLKAYPTSDILVIYLVKLFPGIIMMQILYWLIYNHWCSVFTYIANWLSSSFYLSFQYLNFMKHNEINIFTSWLVLHSWFIYYEYRTTLQ